MTKKRGRGHLKRPHRPAEAALERAALGGLPPLVPLDAADVYHWVYDAASRYLVHEYCWVSAENEVDIVHRPTGREARFVDSAWVPGS